MLIRRMRSGNRGREEVKEEGEDDIGYEGVKEGDEDEEQNKKEEEVPAGEKAMAGEDEYEEWAKTKGKGNARSKTTRRMNDVVSVRNDAQLSLEINFTTALPSPILSTCL